MTQEQQNTLLAFQAVKADIKDIRKDAKFIREQFVSVREFGVKGDGSDDTAALLEAVAFSNQNKVKLYFPAGLYVYTQTLENDGLQEWYGNGSYTNLRPVGCNGIKIKTNTGGGCAAYIHDLLIQRGGDAAGTIGIDMRNSENPNDKVYGINLERLTIYFFDTAIFARTMWKSSLKKIVTTGCYNGLFIDGQCVANEIYDFQYDGIHAATPTSSTLSARKVGIVVQGHTYTVGNTYLRPESIHIFKPYIAFAGYGILWSDCLLGSINNFDIDFNTYQGIYVNNYDGGLTIRGGSIYGTTGCKNGIFCVAKAIASNDFLSISDVLIGAWNDTDFGGLSTALDVQQNNRNVSISNVRLGNASAGKWFRGLYVHDTQDVRITAVNVNTACFTGDAIRVENSSNVWVSQTPYQVAYNLVDFNNIYDDKLRRYGLASQALSGSVTTIAFPHGLGTIPGYVSVQAANAVADQSLIKNISADATSIIVTYKSAPASGTGQWYWQANR